MLIRKERIPFKKMATFGMLPSVVKILLYKIRGYKIGSGVSIGIGSIVDGKNVEIKDGTRIGLFTVITAEKIKIDRNVKIGSMVFIDTVKLVVGDDSRINEKVIIGGMKEPGSSLMLGKRTILMEYSFLNPTKPIKIGDDSGIGGHCLLFTHSSWLSELDGFPVEFSPITIGKKVWLPWRVFILPGVNIGDNVVIGANALVTKSLPSNCLAVGSPAKVVRENYPQGITDEKKEEIVNKIINEFSAYLEFHGFYVEKTEKNVGINLHVQGKKGKYNLLHLKNEVEFDVNKMPKTVVVIEKKMEKEITPCSKVPMVIDLYKKTRAGRSDIGEEYLRFISRFGIRLNRLD